MNALTIKTHTKNWKKCGFTIVKEIKKLSNKQTKHFIGKGLQHFNEAD